MAKVKGRVGTARYVLYLVAQVMNLGAHRRDAWATFPLIGRPVAAVIRRVRHALKYILARAKTRGYTTTHAANPVANPIFRSRISHVPIA